VKEFNVNRAQVNFAKDISIEHLSSGLYILTIKSESDIVVKKFIKN